MRVHDKIRMMRELNRWSQEEMAEKMNMSLNGYAKIERGETKLNLEKLEQIAQIFNTDIIEFINNREGSVLFFMNRNSDYTNYSTGNDALIFEIEKLKLTVQHQQEMLTQKEKEIELLKELMMSIKK